MARALWQEAWKGWTTPGQPECALDSERPPLPMPDAVREGSSLGKSLLERGRSAFLRWRERTRSKLYQGREGQRLGRTEAAFFHLWRFVVILFGEIRRDKIWHQASSLTYVSILSLFPLLLLMTSLASVFYSQDQEQKIVDWFESRWLPPTEIAVFEEQGAETEESGGDGRSSFVLWAMRKLHVDPDRVAEQQATEQATDQVEQPDGTETAGPAGDSSDDRAEIGALIGTIRQMSETYRKSAARVGFWGFVGMLLAGWLLYRSMEHSFESAWGINRGRSIIRTITGFTTLIVLTPLLIGLSITLSSFIVGKEVTQEPPGEQGAAIVTLEGEPAQAGPQLPVPPKAESSIVGRAVGFLQGVRTKLSGLVAFALSIIPWLLNSCLLALAYMLIPQARVRFRYALIGGLTAGIIWELAKIGFFFYVFLSASRRELLRTLGAVPIFLIWIYFTWVVFLIGNELTFVTQNLRRLRHQYFNASPTTILDGRLVLAVTLLVADAFEKQEGGIHEDRVFSQLRLPLEEIERTLNHLQQNGILKKTSDGYFLLARPAAKLRVDHLLALGCDPVAVYEPTALTFRPDLQDALSDVRSSAVAWGSDLTIEQLLTHQRRDRDSEG